MTRMMWRTVAALSALWCVLAIAPGVVSTILFAISTDTPIDGVVVAVWIVGFLLQFAVFLLIGRKVRRDSTLGTIIASIMPFAADWSAPICADRGRLRGMDDLGGLSGRRAASRRCAC